MLTWIRSSSFRAFFAICIVVAVGISIFISDFLCVVPLLCPTVDIIFKSPILSRARLCMFLLSSFYSFFSVFLFFSFFFASRIFFSRGGGICALTDTGLLLALRFSPSPSSLRPLRAVSNETFVEEKERISSTTVGDR